MLAGLLLSALAASTAVQAQLTNVHIDLWYNGGPGMGVPNLSCPQWSDPAYKNPATLMVFDKAAITYGDCINEFRSWGKFYCDSPGTLRWDKYNSAGCSGAPDYVTYPAYGGCIPGNPLTVSTVFTWQGDCLPAAGASTPAPITPLIQHPHPHIPPPKCKKGGSLGDCRSQQMHCAKAVSQPPTLEKMRWCMYDLVDCGSNNPSMIPSDCCKEYILSTRPSSDTDWNNLVNQEQAANNWPSNSIAEAQVIYKRCSALGITPAPVAPVVASTPSPTSLWSPLPSCSSGYSVANCISDGVQFHCANEALAKGLQPNPTTMAQCVYDIVDCKHAPSGIVSGPCCDAHVINTRRTADPGWGPQIAQFAQQRGLSNAAAETEFIRLGCNTLVITPSPVSAPAPQGTQCTGKKQSACAKLAPACVYDKKNGGCIDANATPTPPSNPCRAMDGKKGQCERMKGCMYYADGTCDASTPTAAPTFPELPFWKATCQGFKGTPTAESDCKGFTFVGLPDKKGNSKTLKGCEWNKKLKRCQGKKIGCKALGLFKQALCDSYNHIGCQSSFKTSKKTGNQKFKKCGGKGIQ